MAASFPTIEDFFLPASQQRSSPIKQQANATVTSRALSTTDEPIGAGFTTSELSKTLILSQDNWQPQQSYDHTTIEHLSPGRRRVSFTARVINLYDRSVQSKLPKAAKGCLKVLVRDNEAVLLVNLWYGQATYNLRLGSLVTIWTTHISSLSSSFDTVMPQPASLLTSIFPERDVGCHLEVLGECKKNQDWYRSPLGFCVKTALVGMMSLKSFLEGGGSEVHDAKVLVYVKAIGPPSIYTSPKSQDVPVRDLGIADESCEALLHLFGPLMNSAENFKSNETILLISYPGWRPNNKLSIKARTRIDVDPQISEAEWLRQIAMQANQATNEALAPWELFPTPTVPTPLLFNLASLSACLNISSGPFSGYLPLVLAEVHLTSLAASEHLFSMEHCHMPIYANSPSPKPCDQCGAAVPLRLNPVVIGTLMDETGCLMGTTNGRPIIARNTTPLFNNRGGRGKLIWTDEAWTDLFGRDPEAMAMLATSAIATQNSAEEKSLALKRLGTLKYLEQRLAWMRLILLVGWTGKWGGGRLCVLRVVG